MSENEKTEIQEKTGNQSEGRVKTNKGKKRKRKTTDQTQDPVELKKSQKQSDEIEGDDTEEVEKKPKEPSKRQLKREKAEKKFAEQREASKLKAVQKGLNYLSKWKHAKNEWKFEKLRQIWLMDHLLDDNSVPDSIFPTALEYFEGCTGKARQQLVKKMMDVIKKVEELNEEEENGEADSTNTLEYQRARQILQALPTES